MFKKKNNVYAKKMQNRVKIEIRAILFLSLCFLCGCVRKDQAGAYLEEWELEGAKTAENAEAGDSFAEEGSISGEVKSVSSVQGAEDEPEKANVREDEAADDPSVLYVHICGAVEKPGVYELPAGSRVFEAVRQAGGFRGDADEDYVNQAQEVPDAGKLVIPTLEETSILEENDRENSGFGILMPTASASGTPDLGTPGQEAGGGNLGLVNINTADKAGLCSLPGIGNAKAEAILAYREKKGRFSSVEELKQVDGIGDGVFSSLKDSICAE